jgi:hypothetical protein
MTTMTDIGHVWETERIRGGKRACAMPASWRRTCTKCGLMEFKSGLQLGATWQTINRPMNPCETK